MTPEELEAIRVSGLDPTPEQLKDYNETLREYKTICQFCGFVKTGTLTEIRSFFRLCDRLCKNGPPQ